ncbi:MAG: preprotein translocase subunit SecG [Bacteriovoracaceae bacterium]
MVTTLIVFQVFICVSLVVLVLLQFGKGAEMGAVMGQGSSQAIFSSSQGGNIMTKATTACAILFMLNSVTLTTIKSREAKKSIFDNMAPVAAPLNNDAANTAVPATTTTTGAATTTTATATTSAQATTTNTAASATTKEVKNEATMQAAPSEKAAAPVEAPKK